MSYTLDRMITDASFDEVDARTRKALMDAGFGVLTEIDVKATMKKKIDADMDNYLILGACNPKLAHTAVSAHPEIGLMLPCNVTVEEAGSGARVRLVDAEMMMGVGDLGQDPEIGALAADAKARLDRVAAALTTAKAA